LYRHAGGFPSLPLEVHGCVKCGYCGYADDFKPGSADEELKRWVRANLVPPEGRDRFPADRCYEYVARIAERRGALPKVTGLLWLKAAWCGPDKSESADYLRFRREALARVEAALAKGEFTAEELPAVTYLAGELSRRIGNAEQARAWFARVPAAVGDNAEAKWFIDLAIQQSTDPKEFVEERA